MVRGLGFAFGVRVRFRLRVRRVRVLEFMGCSVERFFRVRVLGFSFWSII